MDYYAVLGLSKGASSDEVKKAFKKKAMKYHPDRTGNDKTAEKKFKEVKEAYDVLSDPQKKSMYDQYGTTDFGGGFGGGFGGRSQGGFDSSGFEDIFEDIFGDIFGGGRARNPNRPYKGRDIEYQIRLTLEEAAFGIEKVVKFRSQNNQEEVSVTIPAGVDNGDLIRLSGKGEPGINQGPPGDLFIRVVLQKHSIFERDGNNLFNKTAEFLMSKNPITISTDTLAIAALELMEEHNITCLFVYSSQDLNKPDGIVHIHDILKTGIQ